MALDERVKGKTTLLGLIGNPVGHTVSPQLHNTLSQRLGLDSIYIPMKVERDYLADAVKGFKAAGFRGFNVTIPFKEDILKHVDYLSDEARIVGCANTVKIDEGRAHAFNTDAEGFARDFEERTGEVFKDRKVLVLGAGGTARSLSFKIAERGAGEITIANRTQARAGEIASLIKGNSSVKVLAEGLERLNDKGFVNSFDIIVNTTSLGMFPKIDESPLNPDIVFGKKQVVYDVIYNPALTRLLETASDCGCKAVNGLGMLFWQGVLAYEIWMDIKVPGEVTDGLWRDFSNYLAK